MSNLIKRQHTNIRTLEDAIENANRLENELPYLIQPENSTFDLITLKNALQYVWIQTSKSTNIICGIWKKEPNMEQRIEKFSIYLGKTIDEDSINWNTILEKYEVE
jgi:hypothetical protein